MRFTFIPLITLLIAVYQPAVGQTKSKKTKTVSSSKVSSATAATQMAVPEQAVTTTASATPSLIGSTDAPAAEGNAGTGKQLFNVMLGCSHCHGVNSVGHGDNRNLREIKKRRGDEWEQIFAQVMKEGRAGTAMPPWSHLSPPQVANIKAFIVSIQEE